jgi:hypothetical protein
MLVIPELKKLAEVATEESDQIDFKQEFSPDKKAAFWAETVKDIVAFANTRGGIIVFGLSDFGNDANIDCSSLLTFDNASLTDQIRKYTDFDLNGLSIVEIERIGKKFPAIVIPPVSVPIVFTHVGTYEVAEGKQKTAFSKGTIYFRHGSKSEPCNREDISKCIDRNLNATRQEWLGNIRKVVEAPFGQTVVVSGLVLGDSIGDSAVSARLTSDPSAPQVRLADPKLGWPHLGKDIRKKLQEIFPPCKFNSHDLVSVKHAHKIDEISRPEMVLKTHSKAAPQYSDQFLSWIVDQYHGDSKLFEKARVKWRLDKYGE